MAQKRSENKPDKKIEEKMCSSEETGLLRRVRSFFGLIILVLVSGQSRRQTVSERDKGGEEQRRETKRRLACTRYVRVSGGLWASFRYQAMLYICMHRAVIWPGRTKIKKRAVRPNSTVSSFWVQTESPELAGMPFTWYIRWERSRLGKMDYIFYSGIHCWYVRVLVHT